MVFIEKKKLNLKSSINKNYTVLHVKGKKGYKEVCTEPESQQEEGL